MRRELRDVVFVDGVRTPFGKAGSMYAETRADDLVVDCIRELLRRHPELPPDRIDDVAIAATTQTGDQGLTIGRTAALLAAVHAPEVADVILFAAGIEPDNVPSARCAAAAGLTPDTAVPDWEGMIYYIRRHKPEP